MGPPAVHPVHEDALMSGRCLLVPPGLATDEELSPWPVQPSLLYLVAADEDEDLDDDDDDDDDDATSASAKSDKKAPTVAKNR